MIQLTQTEIENTVMKYKKNCPKEKIENGKNSKIFSNDKFPFSIIQQQSFIIKQAKEKYSF
jgi:hypothetical protein